jgi:hypothetical protein
VTCTGAPAINLPLEHPALEEAETATVLVPPPYVDVRNGQQGRKLAVTVAAAPGMTKVPEVAVDVLAPLQAEKT